MEATRISTCSAATTVVTYNLPEGIVFPEHTCHKEYKGDLDKFRKLEGKSVFPSELDGKLGASRSHSQHKHRSNHQKAGDSIQPGQILQYFYFADDHRNDERKQRGYHNDL